MDELTQYYGRMLHGKVIEVGGVERLVVGEVRMQPCGCVAAQTVEVQVFEMFGGEWSKVPSKIAIPIKRCQHGKEE